MSEQTTPQPPTTPPGCKRHRRRGGLRRLVLATALLGTGFGIGIATTAMSQGSGPGPGYGPRGGWSENGPGPGMGPGMGPGWHGRWHGGSGQDGSGPGWGQGWGPHRRHFGGPMFGPGTVERMVERLVHATDASSEQRQKMNTIAQRAAEDIQALRERHIAGRTQIRDALAAPVIDRAKLETLRAEQMKLADEASRRITAAIADIAEVLTPTQRADLAKRIERFGPRR